MLNEDNNKQTKKMPKDGENKSPENQNNKEEKELTSEEKLKEIEEKLLRSLAEIRIKDEDLKRKLKTLLNLDLSICKRKPCYSR